LDRKGEDLGVGSEWELTAFGCWGEVTGKTGASGLRKPQGPRDNKKKVVPGGGKSTCQTEKETSAKRRIPWRGAGGVFETTLPANDRRKLKKGGG